MRSWWASLTGSPDWMTTRPALVAPHDRENWNRIGSPTGLGFGFGDREAVKRGACMFGAKFRLPPDVRLGDLVTALRQAADLVDAMSALDIEGKRPQRG